ncbi:hypothetical protein U9M48_027416 [Paspalum notatum var. saurae]|uniref:Uncharacterized protein n=1 Tax=Paspalum notatum var. saurae TaxID=547442 RepID=A0AAQ3TUC0_PASNO
MAPAFVLPSSSLRPAGHKRRALAPAAEPHVVAALNAAATPTPPTSVGSCPLFLRIWDWALAECGDCLRYFLE